MRDNSPLSKSTIQNTDTETTVTATTTSFKRGGYLRSTAGPRLQYDANCKNNKELDTNNFIK